MRPALVRAVAVVRAGLAESPPMRPPDALRRVLGFAKLQGPALVTVRRALEADDELRARVAMGTAESEVGRAGWLWLVRPEGWADELAALAVDADATRAASAESAEREAARLRRAHAGAQELARRHEQAAVAARDVGARATAEATAERTARRAAEETTAKLRDELRHALDERAAAVRAWKDTEAELAATKHALKVARAALHESERELAEVKAMPVGEAPRTAAIDGPAPPVWSGERPDDTMVKKPPVDLQVLGRRVADAAEAASTLSRALAEAAVELSAPADGGRGSHEPPRSTSGPPPARGPIERRSPGPGSERARPRRRPAGLPPGVWDDTPEAASHLLRLPQAVVLVDGYNVARTAWSGLSPEQERDRLLPMLGEVHSRTGAELMVVFDGVEASAGVPGRSSPGLRVRFTAQGVPADDVLLDLVSGVAADRPIVVVSSDREVADGARRQGANTVSSRQFLTAARRA